jgi:hypothetical protein
LRRKSTTKPKLARKEYESIIPHGLRKAGPSAESHRGKASGVFFGIPRYQNKYPGGILNGIAAIIKTFAI